MSEYIVDGAEPNSTVLKSITENGYEHEKWLPVREEIVRCRDCKRWESGDCDWNHYYDDPVDDQPDGFCSWGERRSQ